MNISNNVVNLLDTFSEHQDSNQAIADTTLPELIISAKRLAIRQLTLSIDRMFNNADDCLFEYAEKAQNNRQQTLYFDAMRELRLRKDFIREHFFSDFEQAFINAYLYPRQIRATANKAGSLESLSLVEEDDLEESLAIIHMSQRILSECREELSAMVTRLNDISENHPFSKEANPLAPDIICNSFRAATECLTPIIEIKLIMFKLFDKFVVQNIKVIYCEINTLFIAAGVLPTIKYHLPTTENSASTVRTNTVDEPIVESSEQHTIQAVSNDTAPQACTTYDSLRQALEQYRSGNQQNILSTQATMSSGVTAAQPSLPFSTPGSASTYYVSHDIIEGLSRLQTNNKFSGIGSAPGQQANSDIIKSAIVHEIVNFRGDPSIKNIDGNEADAIDIVSLMFDYILNDSRLPDQIKLSIGRLQIPIVKVAIIDSEFFAKKNHPARELLNELAHANFDLNASSEFSIKLIEKIDYVVSCILNEFMQDIQIFKDLLIEFKEFLQLELKIDRLANEMLLAARSMVDYELQLRLEHNDVPDTVRQFFLGPWKDVLNLTAIKYNCQGVNWDMMTSFMDNLLWSIQPKHDISERTLLTQEIPVLLLVIHEGINQIDKYHKETSCFIIALEKLHFKALRSNINSNQDDNEAAYLHTLYPVQSYSDTNLLDTVAETTASNYMDSDIADSVMRQSKYYEQVSEMSLDTWIEFKHTTGTVIGKLSWKSDFTGDYVFTSRTYKTIADLNIGELIHKLENGTAKLINDIPILDKAIDSIIKTLHSCVSGWKDATSAVL